MYTDRSSKMKIEEFIKRLEEIKKEYGNKMEIVAYHENNKYLEPVASIMPVHGSKKVVIL